MNVRLIKFFCLPYKLCGTATHKWVYALQCVTLWYHAVQCNWLQVTYWGAL